MKCQKTTKISCTCGGEREAIMIWCEIFLIWNFQTIRMSFCLSYTLSSKYASSPQTHIHLAVKYTILSQMEWTELHTIVVNLFLKLKLLVGTIWRLFYSCKSQSPASIINEVKQWNVGRWKRVREEKNQFNERLNRLYRPKSHYLPFQVFCYWLIPMNDVWCCSHLSDNWKFADRFVCHAAWDASHLCIHTHTWSWSSNNVLHSLPHYT